ncbi:uncharacterized protein LOC122624510 isoform X2 [Drosophila teissieri]|uniref:uncharacterized protein LOC122624510 isoform X2 n=1 Tax=Drosophila teissieri TaxID=7243 RepID=UPI001CB9E5CC|nr:uncharacterized protein LOC122624510 isoform X2 [Drosophila teissieri]
MHTNVRATQLRKRFAPCGAAKNFIWLASHVMCNSSSRWLRHGQLAHGIPSGTLQGHQYSRRWTRMATFGEARQSSLGQQSSQDALRKMSPCKLDHTPFLDRRLHRNAMLHCRLRSFVNKHIHTYVHIRTRCTSVWAIPQTIQ